MDFLQKIGGVGEVLIFAFCFLMVYHHDLLMNMFLLNNSILLSQYNVSDKKIRKNQIADVSQTQG